MSASGGIADIPDTPHQCPLMTLSGHSTFTHLPPGEGNLTRIRVVEAPQRAEDIFEFVGLFPSVAQHLYHPLQ